MTRVPTDSWFARTQVFDTAPIGVVSREEAKRHSWDHLKFRLELECNSSTWIEPESSRFDAGVTGTIEGTFEWEMDPSEVDRSHRIREECSSSVPHNT